MGLEGGVRFVPGTGDQGVLEAHWRKPRSFRTTRAHLVIEMAEGRIAAMTDHRRTKTAHQAVGL